MNAVFDLRGAILRGFKQVDRGFMDVHGRLDRLERRVTSVEDVVRGLERSEAEFEVKVHARFDRLEERMARVES